MTPPLTEATVRALVHVWQECDGLYYVADFNDCDGQIDGAVTAQQVMALAADWLAMRAVLAEVREELAARHTDFTPWIPQTLARLDAVLKGGE